jgi:hypothetical protein
MLYKEKIISMREFDEKEYSYKRLLAEYRSAIERQLSQWQSDLTTQQIGIAEIQSQESQFLKEKELYRMHQKVWGNLFLINSIKELVTPIYYFKMYRLENTGDCLTLFDALLDRSGGSSW